MQNEENDVGTKEDLVKYRITSAEQNIKDAKLLLEAKSFDSSSNRSYYAIFHAINAIHALDGNGYKRHKDTIGNFNQRYIKSNIFPREFGRKIVMAENARHKSDYADYHSATKEDAEAQLLFAEEFVETVKCYLIKHGLAL